MIREPAARQRGSDLAIVFTSALGFYVCTLAPTVVWGDSAALARQVLLDPLHIGTAANHPLFVLVGRVLLFLPGEIARLLNFESALFGALAVTMLYRCARQLGTSRLAAATGAAALCVSHAFWLHSVIAEVYTGNAFFLAATLSLLLEWRQRRRRRHLAAAFAVFLIGLTNHLVLAAAAPAAVMFVVASDSRVFLSLRSLLVLVAIVTFVGGVALLSPSLARGIRTVWVGPPSIWEYFRPDVEPRQTAREAGFYLLLLLYQFPSIALPLGVAGAWTLVRRDRGVAALLLLTIAVNAGIFIHNTDWSTTGGTKFVFYISDYVVFAILCAVGANELERRLATRTRRGLAWSVVVLAIAALLPPAVYASIPAAASRAGIELLHARQLPYRDNQRYFLNPNKHGETGARRYATDAFRVMKPGAVLFADSTPYEVLRYVQYVDHVRPDVLIRSPRYFGDRLPVEWVFDEGRRRPTYLAALTPDYDLRGLTGGYDLVPVGPIIEVRPRP